MKTNRNSRRRGFTLMEVLLVLVILVILSAISVAFLRRTRQRALVNAAKTQIGQLDNVIKLYELDMLAFPQSLEALRIAPSDSVSERWNGPYLDKEIPLDPWDNPYQYELQNEDYYKIWSFGPDRADGTEDDITNIPA